MANRNNRKRNKVKVVKPKVFYQELDKSTTAVVVEEVDDPDLEKITHAAVEQIEYINRKVCRVIYTLPFYMGHSRVHDQIIRSSRGEANHADIHVIDDIGDYHIGNSGPCDGYKTNKREFITRQEAASVAKAANQISNYYADRVIHSLNSYHLKLS